MKAIVEFYYCDFCGGEITNYPYDPNNIGLPSNHAWTNFSDKYQTVVLGNQQLAFCRDCCKTLRNAIGLGFVKIDENINDGMMYDAGWRKDNGKWIPLSLYNIKKEKGLIND